MQWMKLIVAAVGAIAFQNAYAFHSGGVAECGGCHSMHSPAAGGVSLLVGTDQSSTCLTCHMKADDTGPNGYHIATTDANLATYTNPLQRTPGGDFSWVKRTFTWVGETGATEQENHQHGHNIIATDFSFVVDPVNATAPGGTFVSANLACSSCHDPHGKYRRNQSGVISTTGQPIYASGSYGSGRSAAEPTATESVGVYRLLGGAGYKNIFPGVPAAKVPSTYNASEATAQIRAAYGVATTNGHATWGNWCGSCHGQMHSVGNYVHPVDQGLGSTILGLYNSYVKSGDLTGTSASAFSSLVPFATNSASYATLGANTTSTAGPADGDQVTCLSCHRAHASGFPYMLRWQMEYEFMTKGGNYIGSDNTLITGTRAPLQHMGRTMADNQAAYYDRPATQFATYQRVLCNKCHVKD